MKRYAMPLLAVLVAAGAALAQTALPLDQALRKAQVNGKYAMLLRQIKFPEDFATHGDFKDLGRRTETEKGGVKNLPAANWVYVYPYWYLWRDLTSAPKPTRNWGPEQVLGPPNTFEFGDIVTAWASRTQDDSDEWLMLEYAEPVQPNAVRVHETYNPGAVVRVSAFKLDGDEVVVWEGKDPVNANGLADISVEVEFKTNRIKVYLDSRNVSGWNEIDAVGLQDANGKIQWARAVEASSTYAQQEPPVSQEQLLQQRVAELEAELARLKAENEKLKKLPEPGK